MFSDDYDSITVYHVSINLILMFSVVLLYYSSNSQHLYSIHFEKKRQTLLGKSTFTSLEKKPFQGS